MHSEKNHQYDKRAIGRRKEDLDTWEQNLRYQQLFDLGQTITSEMNMDALFQVIMDQTNQIMNTERSTIPRKQNSMSVRKPCNRSGMLSSSSALGRILLKMFPVKPRYFR